MIILRWTLSLVVIYLDKDTIVVQNCQIARFLCPSAIILLCYYLIVWSSFSNLFYCICIAESTVYGLYGPPPTGQSLFTCRVAGAR